MSPYPIASDLDYSGGGVGYFEFMPLEKESLAVCLGEAQTPLFYARIDPVHRRLVYANNASQGAVLVRQHSSRVFHLENGGTMRLEPGDVIAAFNGNIHEEDVVAAIRENSGANAARMVNRMLDSGRGTAVAVRFISTEEPALAEGSVELDLAVA
jgi:hypothetical protein